MKFNFDVGEDGAAEAVGEEAGLFVFALGLAAEGGVAAMPSGATTTNPPRITDFGECSVEFWLIVGLGARQALSSWGVAITRRLVERIAWATFKMEQIDYNLKSRIEEGYFAWGHCEWKSYKDLT